MRRKIKSTSDDALLHAAAAGDADAFGVLYRRHRELVLAYLARRIRQPEAAADLMAETFAAALLALREPGVTEITSPAGWLLTIARNKLIDSRRRSMVETRARERLGIEPLVIDDDDLERVTALGADEALATLADQLDDEQRHVVRARVIDERDYAAIAAELSCSELVVRKRLSRALQSLRAAAGGEQ